ncbi:MAG: hypothetical protein QOD87_715 [Pseudonocardiales bacterium]|nr:hypothetical protein [Pseudonocardiales bacterium]
MSKLRVVVAKGASGALLGSIARRFPAAGDLDISGLDALWGWGNRRILPAAGQIRCSNTRPRAQVATVLSAEATEVRQQFTGIGGQQVPTRMSAGAVCSR